MLLLQWEADSTNQRNYSPRNKKNYIRKTKCWGSNTNWSENNLRFAKFWTKSSDGISPIVAIKIWKISVIPKFIYGLEVIHDF